MAIQDSEILQFIWNWLKENYVQLIVAAVVIIVSLILMIVITSYIRRLEDRNKLTENYSKVLIRIIRFIFVLILLFSILIAFNVTVGAITGAVAVLGGTILGFAAMNTLGNAIAGLIIMVSKPIHIGDRLFFKEQYADVISIEIIYTKLVTLEKAEIIIPNQELLRMEIINYGKKDKQLRRSCKITVDYTIDVKVVETLLLEALDGVVGVLSYPEPKVIVREFQDFAVEYSLFYTIDQVQNMFSIASTLRKNVLETARKYNVDMRTPHLIQKLNEE
jgi:small-conductance mechanosensitive channel